MKYIIVPGLGNSGPQHWQTYFEKELKGIRVVQKYWNQPVLKDWVNALKEVLSKMEEEYVIIAHSLGCITVLHYLKKNQPELLKGLFFVAPADTESTRSKYDLTSFNPIPGNKLSYKTLVIGSSNDPWMGVNRVVDYSDKWGAELLLLDNAGHINVSSGYGKWEGGLELLHTFFEVDLPELIQI